MLTKTPSNLVALTKAERAIHGLKFGHPVATRKKINKRVPLAPDLALGQAIRLARLDKHMSQGALGKKIGVTFQQIQKYEKGANRVGFSRLAQISTALNCSIEELTNEAQSSGKSGKVSPVHVLLSRSAATRRLIEAARILFDADRESAVAKLAALAEELAGST